MKKPLTLLAGMMMAQALINPYSNLYSKQTVTTPKGSIRSTYNLPLWTVGKHKIYAKNPKDALKYAKKRGIWDGKSYPMRVI